MNISNEQLYEPCGTCDIGKFVQWCPIWDCYLCYDCRVRKSNQEIGITVKSRISKNGVVTANG